MADNTSSIAGLFMTPELYQQQQDQNALAQAAQLAQMTGRQRADLGWIGAGQQVARGLAGALGAEDPMLKQITAVNSVMKSVNPNDPRSLMLAAQQLAPIAPQQAAQLAQNARAAQEQLAKTSSEGLVGKLLATGKYTPESLANFNTSGNPKDLEVIDATSKPSDEWLAVAREMGLKAGRSFNEYTPDQVAAVNKAVFSKDIQKKAAGAQAIRVDLGSALEKVFLSKDREEAAKNWAKAGEEYKSLNPLIQDLSTFEKVAQTGFSGAGYNAKLALSKALAGAGVPISSRATDTEIANAISSRLVQQIAKVFPGSQSNKELDQLLQSKPNMAQEAPTIIKLINRIKDETLAKKSTYEQMAALNDKDRSSFNPNIAEGSNFNKISRYRELQNLYRTGRISDAQRAEAKKIQEELKIGD